MRYYAFHNDKEGRTTVNGSFFGTLHVFEGSRSARDDFVDDDKRHRFAPQSDHDLVQQFKRGRKPGYIHYGDGTITYRPRVDDHRLLEDVDLTAQSVEEIQRRMRAHA